MTLLCESPRVQADAIFAPFLAPEPSEVVCHEEAPEYSPTAHDEAWDAGWRLGRSGRSIYDGPGEPEGWPSVVALQLPFCSGVRAGREAKHVADMRELGHDAGYRETGLSEPPGGLSDAAKRAYREGYAAGVVEAEDERDYGAWVDSREAEAREFECRIDERDVYPAGCVS